MVCVGKETMTLDFHSDKYALSVTPVTGVSRFCIEVLYHSRCV
jgi:hypothetical protein